MSTILKEIKGDEFFTNALPCYPYYTIPMMKQKENKEGEESEEEKEDAKDDDDNVQEHQSHPQPQHHQHQDNILLNPECASMCNWLDVFVEHTLARCMSLQRSVMVSFCHV